MPRPSLRSRTLGRVKKRIPGGASVVHYFRRKPSAARCSECRKVLHGVASKRPIDMKRLAKSKKTTSRTYGGNMCSSCTREMLKARARSVGAVKAK